MAKKKKKPTINKPKEIRAYATQHPLATSSEIATALTKKHKNDPFSKIQAGGILSQHRRKCLEKLIGKTGRMKDKITPQSLAKVFVAFCGSDKGAIAVIRSLKK